MSNKRITPLYHSSWRVSPKRNTDRNSPLPYLGVTTGLREDTGQYIALVEIDWDAGTEYYSFVSVRTPSLEYLPYVLDISPIRREVALTGGLSSGECTVRFVNSPVGQDRYFVKKLGSVSARGRKLRVRLVNIEDGYSGALRVFEGKITGWTVSGGEVAIEARDNRFDEVFEGRLAQTVPLIDKFNFTGLPTYGVGGLGTTPPVLAPIVMGRMFDPLSSSLYGYIVPCFLVDTAATPGNAFVYVIGCRPLTSQLNTPVFYRYGVSTLSGTFTTAAYNGQTYAVVTFATEQRSADRTDELEITAWMNGITEDDGGSSVPILEPVRMLEYLLDTYTSLTTSTDFDTTLQTTAKTTSTNQGYATEQSTPVGYGSCAFGGVIYDMDSTWLQIIENFCKSIAASLYSTREGKLATFVDVDDAVAVDFSVDDETDIIRGSFSIRSNNDTASVLDFHYLEVPPIIASSEHGEFAFCPSYRIPGEKSRIGGYDVRKNLQLPYIRNAHAATEVVRVFADYYSSQSQWVDFDLPIRHYRNVDLNKYIGITHWQGISSAGGYDAIIARITGIEVHVQPTDLRVHVTAFKKATFTVGSDAFTRSDSNSLGSSWTEDEDAATNIQILTNRVRMLLAAGGGATNALAFRTETYGANQLARVTLFESVGGSTTGTLGGIFVRGSGTRSSFTGYAAIARGTNSGSAVIELREYNAEALSAGTLLATATMAGTGARFASGDELEIRADGTSIEVYSVSAVPSRNGLILSATDSTITSGTPGLVFRSSANGDVYDYTFDWDSFYARDF